MKVTDCLQEAGTGRSAARNVIMTDPSRHNVFSAAFLICLHFFTNLYKLLVQHTACTN